MLIWLLTIASCIGIIGIICDKIVMNELKMKINKIIERNFK